MIIENIEIVAYGVISLCYLVLVLAKVVVA